MKDLSKDQLHKKIKKALTDEGTVLFIGSGVSAWSGLPSWQRLLDELANFIRLSCRIDTARPHLIHELIVDLGSYCYITTNYDSLLEQTLQQRGLLNQYKVVSNRKAIDCAEIVHIRKKNFIFKPHGDVSDCESIVLSAEQYQRLYENGDKAYVYRTLETLLLTCTVIFIGFGLTDPDFLHIIGKIKNEFQHNPRDHFAIVPDVSDAEKDYWFSNYGIQILSYETQHTENGRDYSSLLPLLRSLVTIYRKYPTKAAPQKLQKRSIWITSKQKFELERYARYLIQQFKAPGNLVFPLMLGIYDTYGTYYGQVSSSDIQNTTSQSFILTGSPGSGKSFFLSNIAVSLLKSYKNGA